MSQPVRALLIAVALAAPAAAPGAGAAAEFRLSSPELSAGGRLAARHAYDGLGCGGGNVSPALAWADAPAGTRSFAVTVYDPDAPTGSGWWHWVIVDLPAATTALPAGAGDPGGARAPKGSLQLATDYGKPGYGGACPPAGDPPHRYVFTLYALKVDRLGVEAGATAARAAFLLNANALAKASFTVYYGR